MFQSSGREQSLRDFSKIISTYEDTERAQDFSNAVGRQPGPAAFEQCILHGQGSIYNTAAGGVICNA